MTRFSPTRMVLGLAAAAFVVGLVFLHDTARGIDVSVATFVFLGACIHIIGRSVRDNEVTTKMLARRDLSHSALLSESSRSRRH